jgi:predicted RNA binding protein YcfA (HicA-like mRNA interferase family)
MIFRSITFAELQNLLYQLDFSPLPTTGDHNVFKHQDLDALIILPFYAPQAWVKQIHLKSLFGSKDNREEN